MNIIFDKADMEIMARAIVLTSKIAKLEGVVISNKETKLVSLCNTYIDAIDNGNVDDVNITVTDY